MSFGLHIWDEPLPQTLDEASDIVTRLCKLAPEGDINPIYVEAARRLIERYPYYDEAAAVDGKNVWSEGPLLPQRPDRLWGVGILSQYVEEVLPFVTSTCNALSLVVYDFQAGTVYLPNGKVLPEGSGKGTLRGKTGIRQKPGTARTIKNSEVSNVTIKAMRDWLEPLGFVKEGPGGFSRWQDDIYVYIACVFRGYGGDVRIDPFGQMGFRQSSQIYRFFMIDENPEDVERAISMTVEYRNFVDSYPDPLTYTNGEDVDQYLSWLKGFVLNHLYPTLMEFSEPEKLVDLYLNRDETRPKSSQLPKWGGISSALTALILARLYAPHHYKKLKRRYRYLLKKLSVNPEKQARVKRLLVYLDAKKLEPLSEI